MRTENPRPSGRGEVNTAPQQDIKTAIPDLADIPLEQVDKLGGNVLAESIALYRARLKENGVPLSSFNARI